MSEAKVGASQEAFESIGFLPIEQAVALMSPEKGAEVLAVRAAMGQKFGLPAEDFEAIPVSYPDGRRVVAVMLTTGNGLDKGSYETVENGPATRFGINVNGRRFDTRMMSTVAYRAFVEREKAIGLSPLPDSPQLSLSNHEPRTQTLLFAKSRNDNFAFFGFVDYSGQASNYRVSSDSNNNGRSRFRPCVEIEFIGRESEQLIEPL